jgi:hydroxypyruvate isomerase
MVPKELFGKVRDGGLRIITMGGHASLSDGLNKRENHDRIEREIHANLEMAVKWEIPALIFSAATATACRTQSRSRSPPRG